MYRLYGWLVSPYTAKVRSYLRFKQLDVRERAPTLFELQLRIKRAVGQAIMPTMITPEGTWLQDSSDIIDTLEARHPEPSITPPGPRQRVAALLLELHGDEWLPMVALHYRWNVPANAEFALDEFGRTGLPFVPDLLRRPAARKVAGRMAGYLPLLGITDETRPGLEAFTAALLSNLDLHLSAHPFLLGTRPCIGDFAMFGPLWAHLWRDPASRHLFDATPHVRDWMQRLRRPPEEAGAFLPNDDVPGTLSPILRTLFEEQMAYKRALVAAIDRYCDEHPDATRVPRALGPTDAFRIGGHAGQRKLVTFGQWMLQRPVGALAAVADEDRAAVEAWLTELGGEDFAHLRIAHPFERRGFKMRLRGA